MTALILFAALLRHDGIVVGASASARPLAAVSVTAHATEPSSLDDACRRPPVAIARATTSTSGAFVLEIDASLPRYFVLYCASGYAPRGEWTLNSRGGRVTPSPVRLWPTNTGSSPDVARRALAEMLDYAAAELHDIQRIDATAHLVAKEGAPPDDIRAIELLDARVANTNMPRPPRDRTSPAAVRAILDDAARHARYFWRAAPAAFTAAARELPAEEQGVLMWLRNRPRAGSN